MKNKRTPFIIAIIVIGVILFGVISYVVITSTASVNAIVPNTTIKAGTVVEESMLHTIQIPANTPKGFITDKSSIVGQKFKSEVSENQLLYINNLVSTSDYRDGNNIPKDYIITTIQLSPERSVGGIVSAGENVDILGLPNATYNTATPEQMENALGDIAKDAYGADGEKAYWILSNVKILDVNPVDSNTSSNSSSSKEGDSEQTIDSSGAYYVIALSYNDYKKLRLSEEYLNLWMNISPSNNKDNGANIDDMKEQVIQELKDAQTQSKFKDEKNSDSSSNNDKKENSKSEE